MAVFGQPAPTEDDADRAYLVDALNDWKNHSMLNGYPALNAGIGLHYGTVVGGVLDKRVPQRVHGDRRRCKRRATSGDLGQITRRTTCCIVCTDGSAAKCWTAIRRRSESLLRELTGEPYISREE